MLRLPTDNLYKFVALSGVLLVLAGLAIITYDMIRLGADLNPYVAEARMRLSRTEAVNAYYKRAISLRKDGSANRATALVDSARALRDSLDQTERLYKGRREEIDDQFALRRTFVKVAFAIVGVGIGLAIWGFISWYTKLQKPLDEIVERQAAELRKPPQRYTPE